MNMNGVYPAPGYSQQIPYQASYGYNPYGNSKELNSRKIIFNRRKHSKFSRHK